MNVSRHVPYSLCLYLHACMPGGALNNIYVVMATQTHAVMINYVIIRAYVIPHLYQYIDL